MQIQLTRIMICKYTPNPKHYPGAVTIEEMAKIDAANTEAYLWENNSDVISDNTSWQIVGSEEQGQSQAALNSQLNDLIMLAMQHGLHDAADYIKKSMTTPINNLHFQANM